MRKYKGKTKKMMALSLAVILAGAQGTVVFAQEENGSAALESGAEAAGQEGAGQEGADQEGAGQEGAGQEGADQEGAGQEGADQEDMEEWAPVLDGTALDNMLLKTTLSEVPRLSEEAKAVVALITAMEGALPQFVTVANAKMVEAQMSEAMMAFAALTVEEQEVVRSEVVNMDAIMLNWEKTQLYQNVNRPTANPIMKYQEQSQASTTYSATKIGNTKWEDAKVSYEISAEAEGDVVLRLDQVYQLLEEKKMSFMPGGGYAYEIDITNASAHTYRYKDGSLDLGTNDTKAYGGAFMDAVGFDGQLIPLGCIGAVLPDSQPLKDLYGLTGKNDIVPAADLMKIYDQLASKGYEGQTALTEYILEYYNGKAGTSYTTVTDLIQNNASARKGLFGKGVGYNGIYKVTDSQFTELMDANEYLSAFVNVIKEGNASGTNWELQIKWPEQELAATTYAFFYDTLLGVGFGEEAVADLNFGVNTPDYSVAKYMTKDTDRWSNANDYFKKGGNLTGEAGTALQYQAKLGIDGPRTDNAYQAYDFSFYNAIVLEQVDRKLIINYFAEGTENKLQASVERDVYLDDEYNVADLIAETIGDYKYTSQDGDKTSGTVAGDVVINVYYNTATTPNEPTEPGSPSIPSTPDKPKEPTVVVPEEEVPLAEAPEVVIPEEEVPLTEAPMIIIPEEEAPLSNVPETGDYNNLIATASAMGLALVGLVAFGRKRKED